MSVYRGTRKRAIHIDQTMKRDQKAIIPRLLRYDELPEWYQNGHVAVGSFRPISNSWVTSIRSLLYLHNETFNVYTHFIPAIYLLLTEAFWTPITHRNYPRATLTARLILNGNVYSTTVMMMFSAIYHALRNHSPRISRLALQADMMGASFFVIGDSFSQIYVDLYGHPGLASTYFAILIAHAVLVLAVAANPHLQRARYRGVRATAVVTLALYKIIPTAHSIIWMKDGQDCFRTGLTFWIYEGMFHFIAAIFFISKAPDTLFPGKFDVWFSSHQLFHTALVLAAFVHLQGARATFDWNYTHLESCKQGK